MVLKSKTKYVWIIAVLILLVLIISGRLLKKQNENITIASFGSSESALISEIVKRLIEEKTDLEVKHLTNMDLGVVIAASQTGDVDMYLTFSGTQFTTVLQKEVTMEWLDPKKVLDYVAHRVYEEYDMSIMDPLGYNNTYALAVPQKFAEEHNINNVSDLKPYAPSMVIAMDSDFLYREEVMSYSNMIKVYDMKFKDAVAMEYGLLYRAAQKGNADAIIAYSSDGRIAAVDLKILKDDKNFFPPYDAMIIVRNETLECYPELSAVLSELSGKIDQDTIVKLSSRIDVDGEEIDVVAEDFIRSLNLD